MLTINGIFDGNNFVALEAFPDKKTYRVLITFVDEIDEQEELRQFTAQTDSFSFWHDERENLYQDYLN